MTRSGTSCRVPRVVVAECEIGVGERLALIRCTSSIAHPSPLAYRPRDVAGQPGEARLSEGNRHSIGLHGQWLSEDQVDEPARAPVPSKQGPTQLACEIVGPQ